jgi:hypothetical protein
MLCAEITLCCCLRDDGNSASAPSTQAVDRLVQEADNREWDGSKVPEYDGINFRRWDRATTGEFMVHNAEWLLKKRPPCDNVIHKLALVVIRQTVDETHENLIDDCKDAHKICQHVVAHHKSRLRLNMPRFQEELAIIRQHTDESAAAYLSRLKAFSSDLTCGSRRMLLYSTRGRRPLFDVPSAAQYRAVAHLS